MCFSRFFSIHRFKLEVQSVLEYYTTQIEAFHKLILMLKNSIPAAKHRKHTPLKPIKINVTKWSSTYLMHQRYQQPLNVLRIFYSSWRSMILSQNVQHKVSSDTCSI